MKEIYHSSAVIGCPHEVINVKIRFSEEQVPALVLKGYECSLDASYGGCCYVSVCGYELFSVFIYVLNKRFQIFQIIEHECLVICHLEYDLEHALLCRSEIEDPRMRDLRILDKLVDDLAKGKPIDKILMKN